MIMDTSPLVVDVLQDIDDAGRQAQWQAFLDRFGAAAMYCDPRWLAVLRDGFGAQPYLLQASAGGRIVGLLPLAFLQSMLFGRFLVSLPYVNWAGVTADSEAAATALLDRALEIAEALDVRSLQLRHEHRRAHPGLAHELTGKAQMRLPLGPQIDETWKQLRSVVRTQVRKGEKQGFTIHWGGVELLDEFYDVFAENMRDLGTPVFGRSLFLGILQRFAPEGAELCVVRTNGKPVGGAMVVHGPGLTEVPSASVLREYRSTAANSLMYWRLIQRATERGQQVFDFGRSTIDSSTYAFKLKWGARPHPVTWQCFLRKGTAADLRPESGKYDRMIAVWQRLPVWFTRWIGPPIVRGIP